MFERFTERARQVVVLSQEESRLLGHNYIGTEHLLLGLLREEEGVAAHVLEGLGASDEQVREKVVQIVGRGDQPPSGQIPFTPRSKKVLELALREARGLGHSYIGTEHLLLGLVREDDGVGARVLLDLDMDSEKIRADVLARLQAGEGGGQRSARPRRRADAPELWRIEVAPGSRVRALLMASAARALDRGDTEISLEDLMQALATDESAVEALAALLGGGVEEPPAAA